MTRETIRRIAAKADVDERTVTALVAGVEVRPASRRRIEKAAKALKIALPKEENAA